MITSGYFRIGNKRVGSKFKPIFGETTIDGDRKNPILGNPFVLKNPLDDFERDRVIELYRRKLESDWVSDGPMKKEINSLAERVLSGEKIIAMCWCVDKPCHLEIVKKKIDEIVNRG